MQLDTIHMVSLAQDGRMVAATELKEGTSSADINPGFVFDTPLILSNFGCTISRGTIIIYGGKPLIFINWWFIDLRLTLNNRSGDF